MAYHFDYFAIGFCDLVIKNDSNINHDSFSRLGRSYELPDGL